MIGQNWTSAYELLPQWPFVHLQNNVLPSVISVYEGTADASLLPALPRAEGPASALPLAVRLWKAEKTVPAIPQAYAIIGSGIQTVTLLTDTFSQGNCMQGILADGDGKVPLKSALGSSWVPKSIANIGFVNERHAWLPENSDVLQAVLQILAGSPPVLLSKTPFGVTPTRTPCCATGTKCLP